MPEIGQVLLIYFMAVSLVSVVVTVHDKRAAKRHRQRVPERTLLLLSALGGSAAMFVTMLAIRHKTRKLKFMAGIPLILLCQLLLVILAAYYFHV